MKEVYDKIIESGNGYFTIDCAKKYGVSKEDAFRMIHQHGLLKAAPGIYYSEETWPDPLFVLQYRNKKIIFSHETALYLHGFAEYEPSVPSVTVERGYNASHLKKQNVQVHTSAEQLYDLGVIEKETASGNIVRVYDLDRTICDILKYRKYMETQLFTSALKDYFRSPDKNLIRLMEYAKALNLEEEVRRYAEVLL